MPFVTFAGRESTDGENGAFAEKPMPCDQLTAARARCIARCHGVWQHPHAIGWDVGPGEQPLTGEAADRRHQAGLAERTVIGPPTRLPGLDAVHLKPQWRSPQASNRSDERGRVEVTAENGIEALTHRR